MIISLPESGVWAMHAAKPVPNIMAAKISLIVLAIFLSSAVVISIYKAKIGASCL
jgi:hypothetical protein